MDQKQRRLIKSNSSQLASTFDFDEIANLLKLKSLVTDDQIDEILVSSHRTALSPANEMILESIVSHFKVDDLRF